MSVRPMIIMGCQWVVGLFHALFYDNKEYDVSVRFERKHDILCCYV